MEDYKLLGLEEKEFLTYKLLIEKGELSQSNVARHLEISKATAGTVCASLLKKGWVKTLDLGERVLYKAENPEEIEKRKTSETKDIFSAIKEEYKKKYVHPSVMIVDNTVDLARVQKDFAKTATDVFTIKNIDYFKESSVSHDKKLLEELEKKNYLSIHVAKKIGRSGIKTKKTNFKVLYMKDELDDIKSVLEVWEDKIYMSQSSESSYGLFIHNKNMAGIVRYLIKQLFKNNE